MAESAAQHANEEYSHKNPNYTMLQAFEWYSEAKVFTGTRLRNYLLNWLQWESRPCGSLIDVYHVLPLTAPTKAAGQESVGYDSYDAWDLGEFDQKGGVRTNWGTKEEFIDAIKQAQEEGIVCYIDAVLNHRFGADRTETFGVVEVDQEDREKEISGLYDIEGWTGFDFARRNNKYSDFKYNFNHFTGVDFDNKTGKTAIFRIHGDGKDWAQAVDNEQGNYDYLMGADIDHAHPNVREDTLKWGEWVIEETGAAGFRFDAVKHIDRSLIADFVKHVREKTSKPKMFAVGEFWKDSLEALDAYLDGLGTQFSVFDVCLHNNFKQAGEAGSSYDLRKIWDGTVVQQRPIDAVTLVDNHDTQVGQSLESWVNPQFKPLAYAMILFRPNGYPCVFWGDLYGCKGENPQEPVSQLGDLIRIRKLFTYGELRDYWDHPNCVGWVRMGDENHDGCAIVLCNGDTGNKKMEVGEEHAGEKWTDVLGWHTGEVVIQEDGWAEFLCSAGSVSVWVKEGARGREEFSH